MRGETRILDAGCGNGVFVDVLNLKDSDYLGIDLCPNNINHARQKHSGKPNTRFEQGDITDVHSTDRSLILSVMTWHHIQDLRRLCHSSYSSLDSKESSDLLLLGVNSDSIDYWISKYNKPTICDNQIVGNMTLSNGTILSNHSMYFHNNNKVMHSLKDAGFSDIEINITNDQHERFAIFTAKK